MFDNSLQTIMSYEYEREIAFQLFIHTFYRNYFTQK